MYIREGDGPGFDVAGITHTVGAPFLRVFCEGAGVGVTVPSSFDHVPQQNQIAHAASPPTLQKTQGWGTLRGNGERKDH
jgi:hypothetical protein